MPRVLPIAAVGRAFPLALPARAESACLLQAIWSSFAFDYVARQKLSGTHLTYGVVEQLACPTPDTVSRLAAWDGSVSVGDWLRPRVLDLAYTSRRIAPYARNLRDDGPPFRWIPERREMLRTEIDAAMFHVYGLTRPEVEHILDSLLVIRKYEERDHCGFRTKRLVLDVFDAMTKAIEAGEAYATALEPSPGMGPRHARA